MRFSTSGKRRTAAPGPWLLAVLVLALIPAASRAQAPGPYQIPTSSMKPTLVSGDRVTVSTYPRGQAPSCSDLVAFSRLDGGFGFVPAGDVIGSVTWP